MQRNLSVDVEHYPIAGRFVISRGAKSEASVVTCIIGQGGFRGRGECVPYSRYGESLQSVCDAILAMADDVASGLSREELQTVMPAGAARNAIDCALWDLEAKLGDVDTCALVRSKALAPVTTAYTISFNSPERMAADTRTASGRPLLKIKLGGTGDAERMRAVAGAAPRCRLIADANEGWRADDLESNLLVARETGFELVEQPLPAGEDGILGEIDHVVTICADESAHVAEDLPRLVGRYDAVNIKLDKAGGLTAALKMRDRARSIGFSTMVGCMVGTSLAMAPAVILAQGADYVDLDGPLLLARDRSPGLRYSGSVLHAPTPELWG